MESIFLKLMLTCLILFVTGAASTLADKPSETYKVIFGGFIALGGAGFILSLLSYIWS